MLPLASAVILSIATALLGMREPPTGGPRPAAPREVAPTTPPPAPATATPTATPSAPPTPDLPKPPAKDTFTVKLGDTAGAGLVGGKAEPGRVLLFFIKVGRRTQRGDPMDAPFYSNPQPVASMEVDGMKVGDEVRFNGSSLAWPASIDELDGDYRVQAVYRRNSAFASEGRGHQWPGNLYSQTKEVTLHRDEVNEIGLELTAQVADEPLGQAPNLKWVEIRSARLSATQGHDVMLRAGVVFPKAYNDLAAKRRFWPTIYVIPGFGGDHRMAEHYASMMGAEGTEALAPQAVYVILDPNGPFGHHGFANAPALGPRGDALVRELIPELEQRYRLVAKPEARIVTGHSSGGWSSLWLQLQYPDVFGACFSSAPDPVDFSAFQKSDLYADENMFTDHDGREQASFRQPIGPEEDRVMMTVREEVGVEHVLGPFGDSGEQWGAWAAMFGNADSRRGPHWAFDPETGAIDRGVVEREWSRYDIARLVTGDWKKYGPILAGRVRLLCGERDSYYLNLAVAKLRAKVEALRAKDVAAGIAPPAGPGYIELVPRATHETLVPLTTMRWNKEMVEYLRGAGLHD